MIQDVQVVFALFKWMKIGNILEWIKGEYTLFVLALPVGDAKKFKLDTNIQWTTNSSTPRVLCGSIQFPKPPFNYLEIIPLPLSPDSVLDIFVELTWIGKPKRNQKRAMLPNLSNPNLELSKFPRISQ